jgi:hypothetical protein
LAYHIARHDLRRAWARFWMGPKLWWDRLWIREDEFHQSLSMDAEMMSEMTPGEQKEYLEDLVKRREIAHQRDMARRDRKVS